ncbi:peptidylprolyl isomerase [Acetivibrio straminisolvens]|jgi:foldase protein PrsA|nr:peptidylprolyl isomerase [Acetivibrio straminisolvens]
MREKIGGKKKAVIAVIAVLAVALAVGCGVWYSYATSYVATVAGEKITSKEYKYFLGSVKIQMENDAQLEDQASKEAFWDSKIEGVDARELAKQRALDSCKEFKIQLLKAKEKGLFLNDKDMQEVENSITTLLSQMAQFNQAAKNTGVKIMSAEEMFKDTYGINIEEYKEILKDLRLVFKFVEDEQKKISVTEEELENRYNENKDTFDKITIRHIIFYTVNPKTEVSLSAEDKQKLYDKAKDALQKVNKGEDMEALALELSEDSGVEGNKGLLELNYTKASEPKLADLVKWAFEHKVGDTDIVETDYAYHVVRLEKRTEYKDVVQNVKNVILAEKYNNILKEWTEESQYDLKENEFALRRIKV